MQHIKIKFQKSPTQKYCKRCKWYCKYPVEEQDNYQVHQCLLFCEQLQFTEKQIFRCKQCIDSEFYENDKRYLKYRIFQPDYETCGNCLLQYHSPLYNRKVEYSTETGHRICPVFRKQINFEQGLNAQGDDVYELHYRCQSCRNAIIKE